MLSNKTILITGGAGLLGQSFVKAVITYSGRAIIADINKDLGEKICQTLSTTLKSNKIDFVELDITSKESIQKVIKELHKKYGKIDALVNNAYPRNKNYAREFFSVEYEDFVENVGLNLGGYFVTSQQFANYFIKQGYGNIINISSIYGVIAPKFEIYNETAMSMPVEYAAIKSALIHLTQYMAKYFKGKNIRVNTLSPGGIFDNQDPKFLANYKGECLSKGMLDKDDVAGTLVYLLSDMSKYVNGQNIIVDDGFCL